MKLSEMNNDQATEALLRLSEPFGNICNDDETLAAMDELGSMRNLPLLKIIGFAIPKFVAIAVKNHKQDLYEIIGALEMVNPSKVGKMNFGETVKFFKDSYDDMLRDFFTSYVTSMKNIGKG